MTNPDNRILSNYATFSQKTKGRMIFENHVDERTCFQRDRDRILHSAAFRRLKHKHRFFLMSKVIITELDLLIQLKSHRFHDLFLLH